MVEKNGQKTFQQRRNCYLNLQQLPGDCQLKDNTQDVFKEEASPQDMFMNTETDDLLEVFTQDFFGCHSLMMEITESSKKSAFQKNQNSYSSC